MTDTTALSNQSLPPWMQFLAAIFDPKDTIVVRVMESWIEETRKQNGKPRTEHFRAVPTLILTHIERLVTRSEAERTNLYFGVCPRFGGGGKYDLAWQIRIARCLWADVDDITVADASARVETAGLPPPSITVNSGNGVHLYWLLAEAYLIDDVGPPPPVKWESREECGARKARKYFEQDGQRIYLDEKHKTPQLSAKAKHLQAILEGIRQKIGGDNTTDLSRLLRIPGSMNRKDQRNGRAPVPCTLVECNRERRYSIETFEPLAVEIELRKTPGQVATTRASRYGKHSRKVVDQLEKRLSACATAPVGSRSEADFALCCLGVREGFTPDEIWGRAAALGKFAERGRRYFDRTWEKAETEAPPTPPVYQIDHLQLIPAKPRRTASKITVPIEIHIDGKAVDRVTLSDALSGRKAAAKQILKHFPAAAPETLVAIDKSLGEILVNACRPCADDIAEATVHDVLKDLVPHQVRLLYRTETGRAFSEVLGKELTRQTFVERFTNTAVLNSASTATDTPKNDQGEVSRSSLIGIVERELRILWGDLTHNLPAQEDAQVGSESAAGAKYRAAMIQLWTKPASMSLHKHTLPQKSGPEQSVQLASRTSLMARVAEATKGEACNDKHWKLIQKGYSAWYRQTVVGGQVVTCLAMRWELARQVGVDLEGVHDQASLTKLGVKFQVIDPSPPVSVCISGQQRIAVLAQDITEELLFDPTLDDAGTGNSMTDHDAMTDGLSLAKRPGTVDAAEEDLQ